MSDLFPWGPLDRCLDAIGLEGWRTAGLPVVESVTPKKHTWGPVRECRPVIVDRKNAYGGAFNGKPVDGEAAGG